MHQQAPLYSQVMFTILHVLLNTSLNNILSSHIIFIHRILTLTYGHISYIKFHLHLTLQNIYTYRSLIYIYIYPCKTSTFTDLKSPLPISIRNWMLPHFLDNYKRERDSDEREYYAGLRREWDFCVNESNALHDELVQLGEPLIDRSSLTLPQRNLHQYERAMTKKKKKKRKKRERTI